MGPHRWRDAGGLEVDDPLAPVGKDAEGDRHGTPEGIGHEGLAAVGDGAVVEGGDRVLATRLTVAGETGRRYLEGTYENPDIVGSEHADDHIADWKS